MAHPSEYYIRFLMLYGHTDPKRGLEHVNKMLSKYCSPSVPEEEFRSILDEFPFPGNLLLDNIKDKKTRVFMQEHELLPLWFPDDSMERVLRFHRTPMIIEHIQLLIFGSLPAELIAERASVKFSISPVLTARAIDLYRHFFWNYTLCSLEEWKAYLYGSRGDHLIASLINGKGQALWRAGYDPKVDGKLALRASMRGLYFRMEALRDRPDTKETAETLTKLTKEIVSVHLALGGEGALLEEAMKQFKMVHMETSNPNIKALSEIAAGGNHSNSGKKE